MKAIIFSNGQIRDYNFVKNNISNYDIIICCDGGVKHTKKLNLIPDYILGDLDSAPLEIINYYKSLNVPFKIFPSKKDETDTEIGVDFAIELNVDSIDLYGSIGTRFDHTLSNAYSLLKPLKNGIKARIIDEYNIIELIDKEIIFTNKKGNTISLLPLTTKVCGITTYGLEYPLKDGTLEIGKLLGVSNVILEDIAKIVIKSGYLFVIQVQDL